MKTRHIGNGSQHIQLYRLTNVFLYTSLKVSPFYVTLDLQGIKELLLYIIDIELVRRILNHSSVITTQKYLGITKGEIDSISKSVSGAIYEQI